MPDYRKPPLEKPNRAEPSALDSDSIPFSIETTTMRLKSLKLRRAESADRQATPKREESQRPTERQAMSRPSGRVRHDERGMAVWDWAVATGEFATLSATNVMQKLDPGTLAIEETQRSRKAIEPLGKDQGGGGDPYNTRGAGQRVGDAARRQGITGSADRPRSAVLDQLTGKTKK
jgi:hypothetical protein